MCERKFWIKMPKSSAEKRWQRKEKEGVCRNGGGTVLILLS